MQTIRHNGVDVLYNVAKLPRKPGDAGFVFRVGFGEGSTKSVDVHLADLVPAEGDADGAAKMSAHRAGLPAEALKRALETAFPGSAPAAAKAAPRREETAVLPPAPEPRHGAKK